MTPLLEILMIVAVGAVTMYDFLIYDQIVRREFRELPAEWAKDGKPIGFFWVPKGGNIWTGSSARTRTVIWWAVLAPEWAQSRGDMRSLFIRLKIATVAYLSLFILIFVVFAVAPR